MKKKYYSFLLLIALVLSSCLKSNLEDLPVYDQAAISNIRFEYRWWDESAKQLRVKSMNVEKQVDEENSIISCVITVPSAANPFTSNIREKVSLSGLAANVDISTAAKIQPVGNSPQLGVMVDFSAKDFTYEVTAANGNKRTWKIKITNFIK